MNQIIEENYISTVKRNCITDETTIQDFIDKIFEEAAELESEFISNGIIDKMELADIILVCLNFAKHYGIDIEKELNKKITINKNRIYDNNKRARP